MKRPIVWLLVLSVAFTSIAVALAGEGNVLENPTLLKAEKTKFGKEPAEWTRRGLMDFSNAKMVKKESAFQFSLTADSGADFPEDCSVGGKNHWDGAEAGYFQIHKEGSPGETWRFGIGSKLLTGGRARIFIYAQDDGGGNVAWVDTLSKAKTGVWRRLRATLTAPEGTESVWALFRGRLCSPGTQKFRFRRANLHQVTE